MSLLSPFSFNLSWHGNSTHGLTHTCTDIWHCSWHLCRHTYICCHMIMLRNITCDHICSHIRNMTMIESYTYVNTHAHDMRWHLEMVCMWPYVYFQKWYICTYKCIQWYNWTWKCPTYEHKWTWKCPTCEHKCSSWHMMILKLSAYEYIHRLCAQKYFLYEYTCPCLHIIYCTWKCPCMSSYALIYMWLCSETPNLNTHAYDDMW